MSPGDDRGPQIDPQVELIGSGESVKPRLIVLLSPSWKLQLEYCRPSAPPVTRQARHTPRETRHTPREICPAGGATGSEVRTLPHLFRIEHLSRTGPQIFVFD